MVIMLRTLLRDGARVTWADDELEVYLDQARRFWEWSTHHHCECPSHRPHVLQQAIIFAVTALDLNTPCPADSPYLALRTGAQAHFDKAVETTKVGF